MNLYVVSNRFETCRQFCIRQGFDMLRVPMASTDSNLFVPKYTPDDGDWVARVGPWMEGKNTERVLDIFTGAEVVTVDAYTLDDRIEWPLEILQRY